MSTKHDQLKEKLSQLSPEEIMETAITYTIELDRVQKLRLAEKQIYKIVQERSQKLEAQNKELINNITVFITVFVELMKLIHASTAKLEKADASYKELVAQLQHLKEVNIDLKDELYAPSTERLKNITPNSQKTTQKEEKSQDLLESTPQPNQLEQNKLSQTQHTSDNASKPEKKKKIKGKRAQDLENLPCMHYYDTEVLKGLDEK